MPIIWKTTHFRKWLQAPFRRRTGITRLTRFVNERVRVQSFGTWMQLEVRQSIKPPQGSQTTFEPTRLSPHLNPILIVRRTLPKSRQCPQQGWAPSHTSPVSLILCGALAWHLNCNDTVLGHEAG